MGIAEIKIPFEYENYFNYNNNNNFLIERNERLKKFNEIKEASKKLQVKILWSKQRWQWGGVKGGKSC